MPDPRLGVVPGFDSGFDSGLDLDLVPDAHFWLSCP